MKVMYCKLMISAVIDNHLSTVFEAEEEV